LGIKIRFDGYTPFDHEANFHSSSFVRSDGLSMVFSWAMGPKVCLRGFVVNRPEKIQNENLKCYAGVTSRDNLYMTVYNYGLGGD